MKFKFTYGAKPKFTAKDVASFSHRGYDCRFLLQTAKGMPVAICQSTDPECNIWKVQNGFSSVFFGTKAEAMAYCKGRFFDSDGKAV